MLKPRIYTILFGLCFFVSAQTSSRPFLGSVQSFAGGSFCKKYKCNLIKYPDFNENSFLVDLIGDVDVADPNDKNHEVESLEAIAKQEKLNYHQVYSKYKTRVGFERDKRKQVTLLLVELRQNDAIGDIYADESEMIGDLLYFATGKKYPKEQRNDYTHAWYTPFATDCMTQAVIRKEKGLSAEFQAAAGKIQLEAEKKIKKYTVTCYVYDGRDKNWIIPRLAIKIQP